MATGENNTTWGDVTNLNLGTALEEAIVGSADVTFASADVTLTLTDTNASQTARNMRLRCTGTTGGATRNLVVPSIEKPYIVRNDCADSVVVKTAAGTGITVPAGKTMWVYSDATNVVDAVTHLSSLTLGTDLAVSDGGTGASTFTANGVIYGNTTSALLATAAGTTGQVLVGNTGGAPSWATLTGIGVTSFSAGTTGFTPSTATTGAITLAGTLGVANGGTGTATAFTAGSVVFAGASGVYSQNNANLFWDNANDRLGIGINTPAVKLQISDVDQATARVGIRNANGQNYHLVAGNPGASNSGFSIFDATASATRMHLDSSGNFGIGTTTPGGKLDVVGQARASTIYATSSTASSFVTRLTNEDFQIYATNGVATGNSGDVKGSIGLYYADTLANLNGGIQFTRGGDALTGWLNFLTSGTERMRIDSSGNVGIGTSSPTNKLTVAGAIDFSASAFSGSGTGIWSPLTNELGFVTAGSTRMRITATGDVGIGTSSPTSKLSVYSADSGTDDDLIALGFSVFSPMATIGTHNLDGNSGGIKFSTRASTVLSERMRITAIGDVLINTTTSLYGFADNPSLELNGAAGATLGLKVGGVAGSYISHSGTLNIFNTTNNSIVLATNNTERMRINSSGNVGIGTSSPAARLDVQASGGRFQVLSAVSTTGIRLLPVNTANSATVPIEISGTDIRFTNPLNTVVGVFDVNGNFGVGTGAVATAKLHAYGTNITDIFKIERSNNFGVYGRWTRPNKSYILALDINNNGGNDFTIYDETAAAPRLTISNTGDVVFPKLTLSTDTPFVTGANINSGANTLAVGSTGAAPVALFTNNTERMRITSLGSVLFGTTTAVDGRLTIAADTGNSGAISTTNNGLTNYYPMLNYHGGTLGSYMAQTAFGFTIISTNVFSLVATTDMAFSAGGAERMRINTSGNVGIGTTTPSSLGANITTLDISGPAGGAVQFQRTATTATSGYISALTGEFRVSVVDALPLTFFTTNTERARIDSSGNLLVGTTSSGGSGTTIYNAAANSNVGRIDIGKSASGAATAMTFRFGASAVGSITYDDTATAYNTSSDYRLKDIDGPIANSGAYIDALKPVQGSWKADGSRFIGLLAHEVQEVSETTIATGEKDGEKMQAMDYSAPELIANLIAEIQSLRARVAQLEGN
jgi:hypothetical protein